MFVVNQWLLSLAQLFSGIGVAVGFAVGSLLAEDLTGRAEYAGFAQTASIMGAGVAAIPLARLAQRKSRRVSLSLGFSLAACGALIILAGARFGSAVLFFIGMFLFGFATASGLQSRYAATDTAPDHLRARALSIVVWATTVGSVLGPNLAGPGGALGRGLGVGELGGPFALSLVAYVIAIAFTSRLRSQREQGADANGAVSTPATAQKSRIRDGFRIIVSRPRALLGFVAVVLGHTVMVSVMVMTPVHMSHSGDTIAIIGVVISLHILGMYALSPVFGWVTDRFGAIPVIWTGFALLAASVSLGIADDIFGSVMPRISAALILLGLGWSACFIAGSALLTESVPAEVRVTIQGTADAGMNFGAAGFAAIAGSLLTLGGFTLINIVALAIVAIGSVVAIRAMRAHHASEVTV